MPTISEIRQQYPDYGDLNDNQLADALHKKFYSDMPRAEFDQKVGLSAQTATAAPTKLTDKILQAGVTLGQIPQNAATMAMPNTGKSLGDTYNEMRGESQQLMGEGVKQVGEGGAGNIAIGAGKTALGGLGFVASPLSAVIRKTVGEPVEAATGIPKEYSEFAAGMALPIPKRVTIPGKTIKVPGTTAAPTVERVDEAADAAYTAARNSSFKLAPNETMALKNEILTELKNEGYRARNAPKTFDAIEEFNLKLPSDVAELDSVRRVLKKAAADHTESDAARRAIAKIDERLSANVPEIVEGRANYLAVMKHSKFMEAVDKATQGAQGTNSGMNFDNKVRQYVTALRNNPKQSARYSANDLAMFDDLIAGDTVTNTLRRAGNMLGGGGGLGAIVTGGMTHYIAPVFGYALKKLENASTANKVNKIADALLAESPHGRAIGAATTSWSQAAQAFEVSPSIRNYTRLTIASRNLGTNLQSAGISIKPEELLKSIMGPMKGAAEQDQPQD